MEADTISGTTLLLRSLPPSSFCAINLLSFTSTPRFQGIKYIPPGFHFFCTSSTNELSVRHGIWFRVPDGGVHVIIKSWSTQHESLLPEDDDVEILRARANLGKIWREGLTPYRQSAKEGGGEVEKDWRLLTCHVTQALLERMTGSKTENHWPISSSSSAARDAEAIPGLPSEEASKNDEELSLLPIDLKKTWRSGATGRERTEAARDYSWALGELLAVCQNGEDEILGELQVCYLMVLTVNNWSCLEQWRRLLRLIFTSAHAVNERPGFFVKVLALLQVQIRRADDVEGGLFDWSDQGRGQLRSVLRRFKKALADMDGKAKVDVVEEFEKLEDFVRERFRWELGDDFLRRGMVMLEDGENVEVTIAGYEEEDETGEYAPTVVELDEHQLKDIGEEVPHEEEEEEEEMDLRY
jgi:A1 cistron-splicing factor AAR2